MTDIALGVLFDGSTGLAFTQGEDRSILVSFFDQKSNQPVNLTGATVGVNFPLSGGGNIKRTSGAIVANASGVVIASGSSPGSISLPDHGLVTGDDIQVAAIGAGVLPAPLAALTNYLVVTIDVNTFYLTDTSGNAIPLTSQGTGQFNITNANDLQITNAALGQATLALRAPVSLVVNAALGQKFQAQYTLSGKTRISVVPNLLDVTPQSNP